MKFLIGIFALCLSAVHLPLHAKKYTAADYDSIQFLPSSPPSRSVKPFAASGLVLLSNTVVWGFNRYVTKEEFAYISGESIRRNFRKGFVWDNDQVGTNMFLHPYHGGLYFNAARCNGYGFWEAGAFALAGSALWEFMMETEYPSINDIVVTPVGGMLFGEIFHRLAHLVFDDRLSGSERVAREIAASLISPIDGLNRVFNGKARKITAQRGQEFGKPDLNVNISTGLRSLILQSVGQREVINSDNILDRGVGVTTNFNVEYGDKFDTNTKPFDYFTLNADLHAQHAQPFLGNINVTGRLLAKVLRDDDKHFLSWGLYQHFDYYDSDIISNHSPNNNSSVPFRFSAPATVGLGFYYNDKQNKKWHVEWYYHANAILMGASLSDHFVLGHRNYNLANGFGWSAGFDMKYKNKFTAAMKATGFHLFTWDGYPQNIDWNNTDPLNDSFQGDLSQATSIALQWEFEFKLTQQLFLVNVFTNYFRETEYEFFDDVVSHTSENKIMLRYKF